MVLGEHYLLMEILIMVAFSKENLMDLVFTILIQIDTGIMQYLKIIFLKKL